ncbi:sulfotransferase 2A1-like [Erinaceus europaeus]|uniref:Sulfotransferase n=1 Tax=Erinaceus europaeus TaxID=9365 RepID=A0A1S3APM8_ERIEU|nr:sulfotransferase 2A1-like [Erinaceus europaeus]
MSDKHTWFEGIPLLTELISPEFLSEEWKKFVFKEDDVLLLTYPKSGTHWMKEILGLIYEKGDPKWNHSLPIWERSPWLEFKRGYRLLKDNNGPHFISTHLPIQLLPKSLFTSKAKVIYVIRNPRDVLVSGYFFTSIMPVCKQPESFEQYFQWFLQGNVMYGSWFEHTLGWMTMRGKENYLMLSYEELKRDTRSTVEKICWFLGKKLERAEMNSLLKHSSFEVMKDNLRSNYTHAATSLAATLMRDSLMRKGISGDWKNHFTVAQAEAFDRVFQEKMAGLSPELFLWE